MGTDAEGSAGTVAAGSAGTVAVGSAMTLIDQAPPHNQFLITALLGGALTPVVLPLQIFADSAPPGHPPAEAMFCRILPNFASISGHCWTLGNLN
jgi:hypothetical protein